MSNHVTNNAQQPEILGHPVGLFVLFFTEMWERFSYYGMRALLILFLIAKIDDDGWGWTRTEAYVLFGWYVMLIYLLPMLGGWVADNKWGHVKTVIVGSVIITLGHGAMAISDLQMGIDLKVVFYVGLFLIVLGTGLFKPNMSSIVGKMYPDGSDKKDGAYTIFYMGVNSGAFIGTLLVGWIGETFSWAYGFGLAGIFMFFGLLQFYFARDVFGKEATEVKVKEVEEMSAEDRDRNVPFTPSDNTAVAIGGFFVVSWIVDGVYSSITRGANYFLPKDLFSIGSISIDMSQVFFVISLLIFVGLGLSRLSRFHKVERDRLIVIFIIAFFVIFFWASFEQAGTTLTVFAKDYTNRLIEGHWGLIYKIIDLILSFTPMIILSGFIYKLWKAIWKTHPLTIIFTSISFLIIWYLVIIRVLNKLLDVKTANFTEVLGAFSETSIGTMFSGSVIVDVSWFQILNPFFIVMLAPLYSKLWKKYTFSGPQKFFIGLSLLAAGFGVLAVGSNSISSGAAVASISMMWLIFAYLLHTMGELAVSPVGLSYVSKLAPARMLAFIFGIWYVFIGMAGKISSVFAEFSESILQTDGWSYFFLIFTIIPFVAGLIILALNKPIKRMMHGVDK